MEREAVLPKNVRQIGDIQGNRRIYMEDYVMTYIHKKEQQEEKGFLGVFLGERRETEDGTLVFIRGLVEVPGEDASDSGSLRPGRKRGAGVSNREDQLPGKKKEARGTKEETDQNEWELEEDISADDMSKADKGLDAEEFPDLKAGEQEPEEKRTVLEQCREFFGPSEIQGCCVIGEYPVKQMERLAEEIPRSRQLLYHLQEQEETLYWTETEKYEQVSGYFVFYEQNKEMQEYMAEMFGEEESEQDQVPDKAIKNFREKIRKKDQIRMTGMLKLASSFFVVTVLIVGAVVVNRIEAGRSGDVVVEAPENEAQNQLPLPQNPTVMINSGAGADQTAMEASAGTMGTDQTAMEASAGTEVMGADQTAMEANAGAEAAAPGEGTENTESGTMTSGDEDMSGQNILNDSAGTEVIGADQTAMEANAGAEAAAPGEGTENTESGTMTSGDEDMSGQNILDGSAGTVGADQSAMEANAGAGTVGVDQTAMEAAAVSGMNAVDLIQNGIGGDADSASAQSQTDKENTMEQEAAAAAGIRVGSDEPEEPAVETAARQMRSSYVIREGDTLADICQTYYGGLDKLALICEANEIEDADMIMPGQKIVLP